MPIDSLSPVGEKRWVQTLLAAFKCLTIWHFFAARRPEPRILGRAALYFPVVGLTFGLILAVTNYVLDPYLHSEILSVTLVGLLVVVTGALHLQGMNETFARLAANDPHQPSDAYSSLGVAAVTLVLLLKSAAVESMDERLTLSLLLTPALARWALLVFLYGDPLLFDGTAGLIAESVSFLQLFAGTAATIALVTYFLGRRGLWIALGVSLLALIIRRALRSRQGAITYANAGAVVEIEEAFSLILLASL